MDTGKGTFEKLNFEEAYAEGAKKEVEELMAKLEAKHPEHGGWFQEGEELVIKGSRFRVKCIKPTEIVLKLLKRAE